MRRFLSVIALVLAVVYAATDCKWHATSGEPDFPLTATFDLTPLSGYDYSIKDKQHQIASRNFTYVFAFCGVVNEVPVTVSGTGTPCYENTPGEDPIHYPAYQVGQGEDMCYRLGLDASAANTRWYLNDNHDPTVGVTYEYLNGDDEHCYGRKRSLAIELSCEDNSHNIPDEEPVYETNCRYMFAIDSIFGCPTECGTYRGTLCGNRGVCKFDLDTRAPHCYCQKGYTGYACNEKGENKAEGFTNTTLIFLVVFFMLVIVELAIVMMWNKVKRLRLDPNAYTNFAAADELA